jgi:peptidoglycan/LPS O-acetylase OafA/YrhL
VTADTDQGPTAAGAQSGRLGYQPALDGLRALAILLVIAHHTAAFLMPSWQGSFFPGGFLGVDLFLVLSGFLITTLLLERRDREPRPIGTFYVRRALRLFPALAALLIANLLYAIVEGNGIGDALRSIVVVGTYVTNWAELAGVSISRYVTQLWSLAIEEQFYLVWPLLLFAAIRFWPSRRRLAMLALSIAALAAAWRAALWLSGDPWLRIYIRTDARADALAIGAALAFVPRGSIEGMFGPRTRSLTGAASLAALVAAAALVQPESGFLYLGGFTLIALAAAALIASLLGPSRLTGALSIRPLVVLGRLSYSLYLWHFGVFQIVAEHTTSWSPAPRVLLAWSVTLLLATASYRLIELPVLALKDRLGRPAPARAAAPGPGELPATPPAGVAAATADAGNRIGTGGEPRAS